MVSKFSLPLDNVVFVATSQPRVTLAAEHSGREGLVVDDGQSENQSQDRNLLLTLARRENASLSPDH